MDLMALRAASPSPSLPRPPGASEVLAPAPAQVVCCRFGQAVAGEDTLLVPADPHDARRGGEVGEVPHLFANHGVDPVEHPVIHVKLLDLIFLPPRVSAANECKPG